MGGRSEAPSSVRGWAAVIQEKYSRTLIVPLTSRPKNCFIDEPRFLRSGLPGVVLLLLSGDFTARRLLFIEP
jgi:hypothetical protein